MSPLIFNKCQLFYSIYWLLEDLTLLFDYHPQFNVAGIDWSLNTKATARHPIFVWVNSPSVVIYYSLFIDTVLYMHSYQWEKKLNLHVFGFVEVAENCGARAALYRDLRIPAHDDHVLQTREARTGIECLLMCTANFPSCISAYHYDEGVKMEHISTSLTFISKCCFFLFVQFRGLLLFASYQHKSESKSHCRTTLSINLCLMSLITIRPAVLCWCIIYWCKCICIREIKVGNSRERNYLFSLFIPISWINIGIYINL